MKFRGYTYIADWSWIVIIPTIAIIFNEPVYREKNCRITFHWLGWHFRLSWMEAEDENDNSLKKP